MHRSASRKAEALATDGAASALASFKSGAAMVCRPLTRWDLTDVKQKTHAANASPWIAMLASGATALALLAFSAPAHADSVKFGARGGSLGYGVEAGVQPHKRFVVRASIMQAEVNLEETFSDIDYDFTLDLGAAGVQADFYPLFGGIYLTAGVFANDNALSLIAVPTEGITLGPTTYTPAEVGTLTADVAFADVATYLGAGWTIKLPALPIETFFEAGAYFQGAPDISYLATGLAATDPQFLADLDTEAQELEEELSILETYPSVNLGLRLTF